MAYPVFLYKKSDDLLLFNSRRQNKIFGTMYRCEIPYNGITFTSSEQMYKYLLFDGNPEIQETILKYGKYEPHAAKAIGVAMYEEINWKRRIELFGKTILYKTKYCKRFRDALIGTGDKILIEYNYWSDESTVFTCKDSEDGDGYVGTNMHGRILMRIREHLLDGTFDEWSKEFMCI